MNRTRTYLSGQEESSLSDGRENGRRRAPGEWLSAMAENIVSKWVWNWFLSRKKDEISERVSCLTKREKVTCPLPSRPRHWRLWCVRKSVRCCSIFYLTTAIEITKATTKTTSSSTFSASSLPIFRTQSSQPKGRKQTYMVFFFSRRNEHPLKLSTATKTSELIAKDHDSIVTISQTIVGVLDLV